MRSDTKKLLGLVRDLTGYEVNVESADTEAGNAEMISAAPGHPVHLIKVSRANLGAADYIVAVQCTILIAMWSHPAGVPQFRPEREKMLSAIGELTDREQLAGIPEEKRVEFARSIVEGQLHQLRSTPFELWGIDYCYRECPGLRDLQSDAVTATLRANAYTMRPNFSKLVPSAILVHSQAMGATLALFWSELIGDERPMMPYSAVGLDTDAKLLAGIFRSADGSPGQRCVDTVDAWAVKLGLRDMYEWSYRPK